MANIAVEQPYEDIKEALESEGHVVKMFVNNSDIKDSDIGVVRHLNQFNETELDVPIIIADGKSVNDIINEVQQRLSL